MLFVHLCYPCKFFICKRFALPIIALFKRIFTLSHTGLLNIMVTKIHLTRAYANYCFSDSHETFLNQVLQKTFPFRTFFTKTHLKKLACECSPKPSIQLFTIKFYKELDSPFFLPSTFIQKFFLHFFCYYIPFYYFFNELYNFKCRTLFV